MTDMTRRTFSLAAMGAMAAAATAGVANAAEAPAKPAYELEDPSTYWGEFVVAPHNTREMAYSNILPEYEGVADSDVLAMVKDPLPLDQIEDAILPDGTVVPAVYVKLRNHINRIGAGIGSDPGPNSFQSLMYLWSEEDAECQIEFPILEYFTAYDWSVTSGRDLAFCEEKLESLASRGMIMKCRRGGHNTYHMLPNINGFWEFNELRAYFENGGDAEGTTTDGLAQAAEFNMQGINGRGPGASFDAEVPLFHTYPIGPEVVEDGVMAPYMDWRQIILNNEKITVSPCQCRLMWKSFGAPMCHGDGDHPFETCLSFGELAEYFDEVGIGRYISQDEAIAMVENCIAHAMVPESLSMKDVDIMCMCHGDCCGNLSGFKASDGYGTASVNMNAYLLKYFPDNCIKCGACVARCPMEAITLDEDGLCLHKNACVRCGQCVAVCPAEARVLAYRGDFPEMGRDYVDAVETLAKNRQIRGHIWDSAGGVIEA